MATVGFKGLTSSFLTVCIATLKLTNTRRPSATTRNCVNWIKVKVNLSLLLTVGRAVLFWEDMVIGLFVVFLCVFVLLYFLNSFYMYSAVSLLAFRLPFSVNMS